MSNFIKFIKSSKVVTLWRRVREQIQDQKQNRQLIGLDRFGNKYYQYYSFYGLPTRREIRFKNDLDFSIKDLVYYQWLHHQVYEPPTQEQKQRQQLQPIFSYLQQNARYQKALQYDRKQQLQMLQFRQKRQELLLRDKALKQLQEQMRAKQTLTDIKTKRLQDSRSSQKKDTPPQQKNQS